MRSWKKFTTTIVKHYGAFAQKRHRGISFNTPTRANNVRQTRMQI